MRAPPPHLPRGAVPSAAQTVGRRRRPRSRLRRRCSGWSTATAGHAAWLAQEVAALPWKELDQHTGRVLVEMYGQERDRLTRASKAALDARADGAPAVPEPTLMHVSTLLA